MTQATDQRHTSIGAPKRWDVPFGDMSDRDVDSVLSMEPFASLDRSKFTRAVPLEEIIRNDTRVLRLEGGEIVCREGDYSNSAFFVCEGSVRVILESLPPETLGRRKSSEGVFRRTLARLWEPARAPEARDVATYSMNTHGSNGGAHIFLQDIPRVLESANSVSIDAGEFFGEIAALGRTPRTATVIADGPCTLLEMRWQGLRDIRRRSDAVRHHIDRLYRERSLDTHLRETPILAHLDDASLERVAKATRFESYGEFDWHVSYKKLAADGATSRFKDEPVIEEVGHYPNGLVLIRSGYARLSEPHASGERTVSYLQRGGVFGLREAYHNWMAEHDQETPYLATLRALGYVDVLRIPTKIVEEVVLPNLPRHLAPAPIDDRARVSEDVGLDTGLLEFLVEHRHVNGTQTMVIDTDRCTRCDDCVRACASTHEGNPRFIRHGPQHDRFMVANACMHCADPVCMIGCPTGAISRDPNTGSVVINDRTCIGCATCANSCPYSNIRMVEIRDGRGAPVLAEDTHLPILKATKCDLCADNAGGPACQRACPHDALRRVDMRDLGSFAKWVGR